MPSSLPAPEFYPHSRKEWRDWLKKYSKTEERIWLVMYRKETGQPTLSYADAVEEALCFGWIDSKVLKRDEQSWTQLYTKRKPKSVWSAINKQRVAQLIAAKQMTKAGMAVIELAKKNGSWNSLDAIESLTIPDDLQKALDKNRKAKKFFESFPPSAKKQILAWISSARKEETRQTRVKQTVTLAAQNIRANQYNPKN